MSTSSMNGSDVGLLATWARSLGGVVQGKEVLCPGPGHSAQDRSLSVRPDPTSPHGFLLHSFAGDDFRSCHNHIRARLGLQHRAQGQMPERPRLRVVGEVDDSQQQRTAAAMQIWRETQSPFGTVVERYLLSRQLRLDDGVAKVIRYHPGLLIDGRRLPAMVALLRDVVTDDPCGVHRTWLDRNAQKIARRMLGRAKHAAMKLDPDVSLSKSLTIGEGVETSLAARQLGCGPVWAVGSAIAIQAFPVLGQIQVLNVLGERDDNGSNIRAAELAAERWLRAGRKVFVYMPPAGDINDMLMTGGR